MEFRGQLIDSFGQLEILRAEGGHVGLRQQLAPLMYQEVVLRVEAAPEGEGAAKGSAVGREDRELMWPGVTLSSAQLATLAAAGIYTLGTAMLQTDRELLAIAGIGKAAVRKIRGAQ